jgi:hypothetical protein
MSSMASPRRTLMSRSSANSFARNLHSYLGAGSVGADWLERAMHVRRVARLSRSLAVEPVVAADTGFSMQGGETSDHLRGSHFFTRHILASSALESLIQIQNDISSLDENAVTLSARAATDAYRHALNGLTAL